MLKKTYGSAVNGIDASTITVEVNVDQGINFYLVGLPDNAVRESQQRIDSALRHVGFKIPGKKITINMAPADIRKEGSCYDLTIALGILAASEQISSIEIDSYIVMGELSLDGNLQPLKGALPIAINAKREGFKGLNLPKINAKEASVIEGIDVYGVSNIKEVIDFFNGNNNLNKTKFDFDTFDESSNNIELDFQDVKGQDNVKRALEIAAAGGHNVILIGPPGAGKTMLARRLPSILPPMTIDESIETTKIHSVSGKLKTNQSLLSKRPFRSPHHSISAAGLIGGGSFPEPGEVSLAQNGVLFLDELPEFNRNVLEVLRQPLEDREVTIARAKMTLNYPAGFTLVASMNPCPCGFYNHPEKECVCNTNIIKKYLSKISGPLLDRIDLHVQVTPVLLSELSEKRSSESSSIIRERVIASRKIQDRRFSNMKQIHCNSLISAKNISEFCLIDDECTKILNVAAEKLGLSARAYHRILKVSRTIADLDNSKEIQSKHLAEAIQYRSLDKHSWGV